MMAIDDEITRLNDMFADEKAIAASKAEQAEAEKQEKVRRLAVLRNEGPQFIAEVHSQLHSLASALSPKIDDPARKLVVGYGNSTRFVLIAAGERLLSNEIRRPCSYVAITDNLDQLVTGKIGSTGQGNEKEISWQPVNGKVELLKGAYPLSVEDFSKTIVEDFLQSLRPRGY